MSSTTVTSNEQVSSAPSFLEMLKADSTNAAYRMASTQMTSAVKAGLLKVMEKQGHGSSQLALMSDILDSEFGVSMVSLLLGAGLTYAPMVSGDPRAQKLATEFRVSGITTAGNAVFGVLLSEVLPLLTQALASLPPVESNVSKVRVAAPEAPPVMADDQILEEVKTFTTPVSAPASN